MAKKFEDLYKIEIDMETKTATIAGDEVYQLWVIVGFIDDHDLREMLDDGKFEEVANEIRECWSNVIGSRDGEYKDVIRDLDCIKERGC